VTYYPGDSLYYPRGTAAWWRARAAGEGRGEGRGKKRKKKERRGGHEAASALRALVLVRQEVMEEEVGRLGGWRRGRIV